MSLSHNNIINNLSQNINNLNDTITKIMGSISRLEIINGLLNSDIWKIVVSYNNSYNYNYIVLDSKKNIVLNSYNEK